MHPFKEYLNQHHLDALTVSLAAHVRYLTVWNATRGNPIQPEHAKQILQAVINQTGMAYTGPLTLTQPDAVDQLPTLPIKKFPKHRPS